MEPLRDIARALVDAIREHTQETRLLRRDLLRVAMGPHATVDRDDAALLLGLSVEKLDRLASDPKMPLVRVKVGTRTFFTLQSLGDVLRALQAEENASHGRIPVAAQRDERDFDVSSLLGRLGK